MVGRLSAVIVLTGLFAGVVPAAAETDSQPPDTVGEQLDGLPAADEGGDLAQPLEAGVGASSDQVATPIPFTAVGFEIPDGAEVWFRTSVDGDAWTDWADAPAMEAIDGPDTHSSEGRQAAADWSRHSDVLWVGEAAWLQTSVIGGSPQDVTAHLIDADGLSQTWPQRTAAALRSAWRGAGQPDAAHARSGQPAIVSRAQWGANEAWAGEPSYSPEVVHGVVHHTATANTYTRAQAPAVVRSIYHYHTQTLGWKDIGYHLLIDRYGTIYEGRKGGVDRAVIGAHAGGFNSRSFGVSLVGNFQWAAPPAAAVRSLSDVLAWKAGIHGIDPQGQVTVTSAGSNKYPHGQRVTLNTINGHRDTGQTACPGTFLYNLLPQLRRDAASSGSAGVTAPVPTHLSLTAPTSGAHVAGTVDFEATATSGRGVQYVVFFVDGQWVGNDYTSPFRTSWDSTTVPDGRHELAAVAVDGAELRTTVRATITVANSGPTVSITSPKLGDRIAGPVPFRAEARSATSQVEHVVFLVDGNTVGTDPTAPYGVTWDSRTVGDGPVELTAVAVDRAGNETTVGQQLEVRQPVFSDILGIHEPSIEQLFRAEVTRGCDDKGRYCPGAAVRRDQMATFIVNASSRLRAAAGAPFADVPADAMHAPNIAALVEAGVTSGCREGHYCPGQSITRAQMATFLVRAVPGLHPLDGSRFADVAADAQHAGNINALVESGITAGCGDGNYCPNAPVTRAQMATFLVKAMERGL